MTPANTIAVTEARLPDGSVVAYRDAEPSHVRQGRFQHILDSRPIEFSVATTDGTRFAVDLVTGALAAGAQLFTPEPTPDSPRLIYYKHMEMSDGDSGPEIMFFVVGWQTTLADGRNAKVGVKVFPAELRWEITEDI